jgi:hypothetical protein
MEKNLLYYLSEIPDKRRKQGIRYEQHNVLMLMVVGTLAGRTGYRGVARYGKEHESYLIKKLELKHGTPSHVSLGKIIDELDLEAFEAALHKWGKSRIENWEGKACIATAKNRVIALDGKAVKSSVKNGISKSQTFVAFVNAFCSEYKSIVGSKSYTSGEKGEQIVLRELIEELDVKGAIFTMDANHVSKKL